MGEADVADGYRLCRSAQEERKVKQEAEITYELCRLRDSDSRLIADGASPFLVQAFHLASSIKLCLRIKHRTPGRTISGVRLV